MDINSYKIKYEVYTDTETISGEMSLQSVHPIYAQRAAKLCIHKQMGNSPHAINIIDTRIIK